MDDNANYTPRRNRRRSLSKVVRNPRVRRMLNLDNIEDGYLDRQREDDGKRTSHFNKLFGMPYDQNKKEPFSYKGCKNIESEEDIEREESSNKTASHGVQIGVKIASMNAQEDYMEKFTDFTINTGDNDVELEEPFSPVVSEYIPESDSYDSDDDNQFTKVFERRKNRKKQNYECTKQNTSSSKVYATTKPDVVSLMADLVPDPEVSAQNLRPATPKSSTASPASTPCSSLVLFKNIISTPDSFKEILRNIHSQSTKNKLGDSDCTDIAQPKNALVYLRTERNKNCLNKEVTYEKFCFVASASTVYNNSDVNKEHAELNSSPFMHTEMDITENVEESALSSVENLFQHSSISDSAEKQPSNIAFIASQFTVYINDRNDPENAKPPVETQRQSRKRLRDEKEWQVNKNKILKNSGKRYHSKRTKKEIAGKLLGDPCACKNKCNEKIDNSERKVAFDSYWQLASHERQWDYILKHVKSKPTRIAVLNSKRPRTQTLIYTLPKKKGIDSVIVCKKMFLQTLNINDKTVYTALEKQESQKIVDLRGRHTNRHNKVSEDTTKSVIDHINMFPRKESHYLRKQTQREYLDEKLNCTKMHRLYLDWIKNNPDYDNVVPASERWYYYIFNTKFNIGFFHPKKDLCDTCSLYEEADSERKEQLKEDYEKHIKNKELVRKIKEQEKENSDSTEKTVACFDLEKVLSLPQSEVGVFHYKRKYPVYNLTIFNILTKTGYCYVWHAQIAKRGANEIASCLWSFLQTESEKGIKEFSYYSDNCTGQNRNRFVFALYVYASKLLNIKITHRFLQKGHTQNEGDSMHSCIEKSKKNHVLYIPEEIYAIIRNAKVKGQKYNVKEMTQEDIYNFKKLVMDNKNWEKDESGNKVNWTKIKEISVDPLTPGKLRIKYDFDEEATVVDTNRNGRVVRRKQKAENEIARPIALEKLYDAPIPISKNLHKDLMSLCQNNNIPPHYQAFYKTLHAESATNGSEIEEDDD